MQNQSKIRRIIIRSLIVSSLALGMLMPFTKAAADSQSGSPQEGGRGKRAPNVTCTTTTYNIVIAIIVITQCSDGSSSTVITAS